MKNTKLKSLCFAPELPMLTRIAIDNTPYATFPHSILMLVVVFSKLKLIGTTRVTQKIRETANEIRERTINYIRDGWIVSSIEPLYLLNPITRERKSFVPKAEIFDFIFSTTDTEKKTSESKKTRKLVKLQTPKSRRNSKTQPINSSLYEPEEKALTPLPMRDAKRFHKSMTTPNFNLYGKDSLNSPRIVGKVYSMYYEPTYSNRIKNLTQLSPSSPINEKVYDSFDDYLKKISGRPEKNETPRSKEKHPTFQATPTKSAVNEKTTVPKAKYTPTEINIRDEENSIENFESDSDILLLDDSNENSPIKLIPMSSAAVKRLTASAAVFTKLISDSDSDLDFDI